jgi:hypothetical protein
MTARRRDSSPSNQNVNQNNRLSVFAAVGTVLDKWSCPQREIQFNHRPERGDI